MRQDSGDHERQNSGRASRCPFPQFPILHTHLGAEEDFGGEDEVGALPDLVGDAALDALAHDDLGLAGGVGLGWNAQDRQHMSTGERAEATRWAAARAVKHSHGTASGRGGQGRAGAGWCGQRATEPLKQDTKTKKKTKPPGPPTALRTVVKEVDAGLVGLLHQLVGLVDANLAEGAEAARVRKRSQ